MKFFSFTTLFVLSSVFLLAQPNSTPIPSQDTSWRYKMQTLQGTFGEIISQADPCFLNNPSDRDIKAYQRWRRFWDGRVADDEPFSVALKTLSCWDNYCSDGNDNWEEVGPIVRPIGGSATGMGRMTAVRAIPHEPDLNHIIAGSAAGGIFKTTNALDPNGNVIWTNVTDDLKVAGLGISDILFDPCNTQAVYASAGLQNGGWEFTPGLLVSEDNGNSWSLTNFSTCPSNVSDEDAMFRNHIRDMKTIPGACGSLLLGTDDKIYRIDDAGDSFVELLSLEPKHEVKSVAVHPSQNNVFIVTTKSTTTRRPKLYISIDAGNQWSEIDLIGTYPNLFGVQSFPNCPNLPTPTVVGSLFYSVAVRETNQATGDWGITLYSHFDGELCNNQDYFVEYIIRPSVSNGQFDWNTLTDENNWVVSPTGNDHNGYFHSHFMSTLYYSKHHADKLYIAARSLGTVEGNTVFDGIAETGLQYSTAFLHADHRNMEIIDIADFPNLPATDLTQNWTSQTDVILSATDGGISFIWEAVPGGNDHDATEIYGQGLGVSQFYDVAVGQMGKYVFAGAIDKGLDYLDGGIWRHRNGPGDGGFVEIDPLEDDIGYIQVFNGNHVRKTFNRWNTESNISFWTVRNPGEEEIEVHPITGRFYYVIDSSEIAHVERDQDNDLLKTYDVRFTPPANSADTNCNPGGRRGVTALGIVPSNPDVIYVGFRGLYSNVSALNAEVTRGSGRFWRSTYDPTTNTSTDENLTEFLGEAITYSGGPITSIEVDPNNERFLWIGTGRTTVRDYIVYLFDTQTNQITNISNGLPPFAIRDLAFDRESSGSLYAATDVGLYYNPAAHDPNSVWECISGNLPVTILNRIDLNYCTRKIHVATYGRGVWKGDMKTEEIVIDEDTEWSDDRSVYTSIRITNNATLTITGEISNGSEAEYHVEPGSKLLLNGGTLTNACNGKWRGICVYGAADQPQNFSTQGAVVINEGTIANARNAISTKDPDGGTQSYGGIIHATGARFINNKRTAEFLRYHNQDANGNTNSNISHFERCLFVIDNEYIEDRPDDDFNTHVTMWSVDDVRFSGCEFRNEQSFENPQRGYGIRALGAGFRVLPYCASATPEDPCVDEERGTFEGFITAIRTDAWARNLSPFTVTHTDFRNNVRGIENRGVDMGIITSNTFEVYTDLSDFDLIYLGVPVGVLINRGHVGTLTENSFTWRNEASPEEIKPSVGVQMVETGKDLLTVYRNTFERIHIANLSNGDNRGQEPTDGLQYECNEDALNDFDIAVPHDPFIFPNAGIGQSQGSPSLSAGNTFSQQNGAIHILNEDVESPINYYWKGGPEHEPTAIPIQGSVNVLSGTLTEINPCPSIIKDTKPDKGELTEERKGKLRQDAVASRSEYEQRSFQYHTLIDGGDTDHLLSQISTAEGSAYLNVLLSSSPFLSRKVLEAVVKAESFSNEVVFEVLYANPDVLDIALINYLIEYRPEFGEDGLIALIDRAGDTTERSAMEASLASLAGTANRNANLVIADDYLSSYDPAAEPTVSLSNLELKTTGAVLELAARKKFADGEWATAQGMLNAPIDVLQSYALYNPEGNEPAPTEGQLEQWSTYAAWLTYQNELNTTEEGLQSYEQSELQAQALLHPGRVALEAENLLSFEGDSVYHSPQLLPQQNYETQQLQIPSDSDVTTSPSKLPVIAAPNPASNEVVFHYRMPAEPGNYFTLRVYDATGNPVFKRLLPTGTGTTVWNCAHLPPGIYSYEFKIRGKRPVVQQLTIIR